MSNSHKKNFTLIEIMAVIIIIAVVLGVSLPAFTRLTTSSAVDQAGRMLYHQLQLVRNEAVAKRRTIALIMPDGNWDKNDGTYKPYSAFRAAYVNDSTKKFEGWVEGTTWTYLPTGAVIARVGTTITLNGSGTDASPYTPKTGNAACDCINAASDSGYSLVLFEEKEGKKENENLYEESSSSAKVTNVRAIYFDKHGRIGKSGEYYLTVMQGTHVDGALEGRDSNNLYVIEIGGMTGRIKTIFPDF